MSNDCQSLQKYPNVDLQVQQDMIYSQPMIVSSLQKKSIWFPLIYPLHYHPERMDELHHVADWHSNTFWIQVQVSLIVIIVDPLEYYFITFPILIIMVLYVDVVVRGDRVAQMIIERIYTPQVMEVEELAESERGSQGFGSTGL
jgi:hypothetical protein